MNVHLKVQPHHLERDAYLYIRQSSMRQVVENAESARRQYALRGRAVALGWRDEQIIVIDNDQGASGASAVWREGFQRLVSDVGMGHAGIVMGLRARYMTLETMASKSDDPQISLPVDRISPKTFPAVLRTVHERHPKAATGLVVNNTDEIDPSIAGFVAEQLIHGVLPLNLRLDVCLAAIDLLMKGGEHFPSSLLRLLSPETFASISPSARQTEMSDGTVFANQNGVRPRSVSMD